MSDPGEHRELFKVVRPTVAMLLKMLFNKSLQRAECDVLGHDVKREDERELFEVGKQVHEMYCRRCDAPLKLRLKGEDKYTIDEE
jgi:hypothetical protein